MSSKLFPMFNYNIMKNIYVQKKTTNFLKEITMYSF